MQNHPLPRLDEVPELATALQKHCRLRRGEVWEDPAGKHRVGCLDASLGEDVNTLARGDAAQLALQDPPYNLVAFQKRSIGEFVGWCRRLVANTERVLADDASLLGLIGAGQKRGFRTFPVLILVNRQSG